jgi:hypothetical protein
MEIIKQDSSLNLPPTPAQIICITKLCRIHQIKEPLEETCKNRAEARNLIYRLSHNMIKAKKVKIDVKEKEQKKKQRQNKRIEAILSRQESFDMDIY